MSSPVPDISVLIVSWNTKEILRDCLRALQTPRTAPPAPKIGGAGQFGGGGLEVIVVDNASTDGSPEMVRDEFPEFRIAAMSENLDFVGGNNHAYGLANAAARYVLLINPDAILTPGALQTMTDFLDAHPSAGACGPVLLNADGTLQPSWSRFPTVLGEINGHRDRRIAHIPAGDLATIESVRARVAATGDSTPRVDWVGGACILLRRKLVDEQLGGVLFDADYTMYCEETDLCYRLNRVGFSVHLLMSAEVAHHSSQSSSQAPIRTIRLLYRSKYVFFRKHYGPAQAQAFRAAVAGYCAAKGIVWALMACVPFSGRRHAATRRDCEYAVAASFLRPLG